MNYIVSLTVALAGLCAGATAAEPVRSAKALGFGANGKEVGRIQNILINQGHLGIKKSTDKFRGLTRNAVIAFQNANRLAPTGVWTSKEDKAADELLKKQKHRQNSDKQYFFALRDAAIRKEHAAFASEQKVTVKVVKNTPKQDLRRDSKKDSKKAAEKPLFPEDTEATNATVFGFAGDKLDNGKGSPYLSDDIKHPLRTRNLYGVALPAEVLCEAYDVPAPPKRENYAYTKKGGAKFWREVLRVHTAWAKVRKGGVEVYFENDHGRLMKVAVRIVDLGPGEGPQKKGVGIDLTGKLNTLIGGDGMTPVAYKIIGGKSSWRIASL